MGLGGEQGDPGGCLYIISSGRVRIYLSNPDGISREVRRGLLDDLAQLNELKYEEFGVRSRNSP